MLRKQPLFKKLLILLVKVNLSHQLLLPLTIPMSLRKRREIKRRRTKRTKKRRKLRKPRRKAVTPIDINFSFD
jgi:hypothetical protein